MFYSYTHTGRAVCPTAGTEGRATIPKFTTGSFTKIVNYRATGDYTDIHNNITPSIHIYMLLSLLVYVV
jgi:hypothetical protein